VKRFVAWSLAGGLALATAGGGTFWLAHLLSSPAPSQPLPTSLPDLRELTIGVRSGGKDGRAVEGPQTRKLMDSGIDQVQEPLPPLTGSDSFRFYGTFGRAVYWYLVWFDTGGRFEINDASPQPQAELAYPSDGKWQTVDPKDPKGVHLLMLIVADVPPDEARPQLERQLGDIGRPPQALPRRWAVRGGGERLDGAEDEFDLAYLSRIRRQLPQGFQPAYCVWLQTR
jgi:hypothetical protein